MAERFALVTVKIATEGKRCANECPHLGTYFYVCRLFDKPGKTEEGDDGHAVPLRCDACLALDADHDRTPEEAVAHDFGSQP